MVVWETAVERLRVAGFVRRRRCDYGDGVLEESESRERREEEEGTDMASILKISYFFQNFMPIGILNQKIKFVCSKDQKIKLVISWTQCWINLI